MRLTFFERRILAALSLAMLPTIICNCRGDDDFRISISSQIQGYNVGLRGFESSLPLISGTSATTSNANSTPHANQVNPEKCFYVMVENQKATPIILDMLQSEWYDCLSFTIKNGQDVARIIRRKFFWLKNTDLIYILPPHGMKVFPIDFTEDGWSADTHPFVDRTRCDMTVNFLYVSALTGGRRNGAKTLMSTSSPIPVLFKSD